MNEPRVPFSSSLSTASAFGGGRRLPPTGFQPTTVVVVPLAQVAMQITWGAYDDHIHPSKRNLLVGILTDLPYGGTVKRDGKFHEFPFQGHQGAS